MPEVYCIRANYGYYAKQFVEGGYAAIGDLPDNDLTDVTSREELYGLYANSHPQQRSNFVIGQQVGQFARFLFDIKAGDYVVTPAADTESLQYGIVASDPSYFFASSDDGCPYRHRRKIEWTQNTLHRSELSVPFQNTMRSSLTRTPPGSPFRKVTTPAIRWSCTYGQWLRF